MQHNSYTAAHEALRKRTGVVIPVYFPKDIDAELGRTLLHDTAAAFAEQVDHPQAVCLAVDGRGPAVEIAKTVAQETGTQWCASEKNRGKLNGARIGMACLIEGGGFEYLAIADQDGDHFANELINLVRAARHVQTAAGSERVMVIGRRTSRTRPMGYLRGELEELADRVLLDALQYDAAVQGRPLRLEFVMPSGEFPDFHSGYKLFDRATAESVFLSEPPDVGLQEEAGYRHAVEAVIIVEALRHGAVPAEVVRSTYNEQPISTFALLSRPRMVADKILWPCKRLGVPGAFVGQWVDNHLARLELGTLAPEGRQELLTIRNLVRAGYGLPDDGRTEIRGPRFV